MGLDTTVFYPFHPLSGRTLAAVSRGKETVTVVAEDERHLKIPIWMTRPDSGGYVIADEPTIDLRALLALSPLMYPEQTEEHATLSESQTTATAGGENETVGIGALHRALESPGHPHGPDDERAAHSFDGGDDRGGSARSKEARR